jgi:hypothetical protein
MLSMNNTAKHKEQLRKEDIHLRWSRDGMFWGPICPQDDAHGGLLDIQGSTSWYCRHSAHRGHPIYSESQLLDFEYERITSGEAG